MSNNTIMLVGRVGQNPVIKTTPTGKSVVNFGLAIKEFSPDGDDSTTWIELELWNGLGDRAAKVITKGREIAVTGRLHLNTFEKKVGDFTVTITRPVVRVSNFHLCGAKPKPDTTSGATPITTEAEPPTQQAG